VSLELPTLRCFQREALSFEYKLDILIVRRKQIIDLVKDRSFVLSAICLAGTANCKIKQIIMRLGIAAAKILVPQYFSYTEDIADLLTFV